ncbi:MULTISPECIES: LysR family transcriptional regulator [Pseudomonas]|jgi:LysR family tcuABC transcriptional regulator|uniref:LysR family transcriptional regulator n=1 Tax=Pseudomonas urmiensis TaxID=2745493 RepID=A0A923JXT0_9PSED|nr:MULTISPECIES: LysR family transcriptional regulator [Pseudomonas]MBV4536474.1 LysR family transcriptional regulator [Pseudomonas urmiensis]
MELRQLRYFLSVLEYGSLGRAALELGVGASALSQQLSKLESELSTRLLTRSSTGVSPTAAGLAFEYHARLALRQAEHAVLAAQSGRMSGYASVGLAPTTASILGLALIDRMRQRYPDIRLHLVEMLSGYLVNQLNARHLDLAVLFQADAGPRLNVRPLLNERLFVLVPATLVNADWGEALSLAQIATLPLVMPSTQHGLRTTLRSIFERAGLEPRIVLEVDGLSLLMDCVCAGHAATIQPGATVARAHQAGLRVFSIDQAQAQRRNLIVSLSDDELSPAALATRIVLQEVSRELVEQGRWPGAQLL